MSQISLPWSMVTDTLNNLHANAVHLDDDMNTLLEAVNNKMDVDGTSTMAADLSMNSYKITNLLAGTNPGDAVNKYQLDSAISSIPKTSAEAFGLAKVGTNITVNDGVISVANATISNKGVVKLGRTNTIANANVSAIRNTVITSTVPTQGEDGVLYFVYSI